MKRTQWIIIGSITLLLLWMVTTFEIFDFNTNSSNDIRPQVEDEIVNTIETATLLVFKKEQRVELWTTDKHHQNHLIISENIILSDNHNGTRLYDNETIIPEGIYEIAAVDSVNLFFTINFPNDFDKEKQKADKRPALNSIITFGIEENDLQLTKNFMTQFLDYAKMTTAANTNILIFPYDFNNHQFNQTCLTCPFWIEELYGSLRVYQKKFE